MASLNKLHKYLRELERFVDCDREPVEKWRFKQGDFPSAAQADFDDTRWQEISPPAVWGGYDAFFWFRTRVEVPERMAGRPVHFKIDLVQIHAEAFLYVNGAPFHGIDRNHGEIQLSPEAKAGEIFELAIEAYAGRTEERPIFREAATIVPDKGVRDVYFSLKNALEAAQFLPDGHPNKKPLFETIGDIMAQIDWRAPGSAAFRQSCASTAEALCETLQKFQSDVPAAVYPVGHAHIDVTWLWTLEDVKKKCGRTFSTVLRLMERYPEFHFIQSQPQLYQYTKENFPQVYESIRQRAKNGRWEPVGGMWVEADCNIPSGESLVRQIVHGKRFFKEEFGVEIDNLWLPDVFGYSAALPQILKKSGIDYFFTAKLAWNDANKFPYNSFWWRGVDGTEIFSHLTFLNNLYNSELNAHDVREAWDKCNQKGEIHHLLLSYGFGDGGGGPTPQHLENARRLENFPGLPKMERASVKEFFEKAIQEADDLPVWWGELYFEYHRGTLTSHARTKRGNRKCEFALREAEFFAALVQADGGEPALAGLDAAWKKLLLNQFHDIIPGTSIPEVYEQVARDYQEIASTCGELVRENSAKLSLAEDEAIVANLTNTLNWERLEPAEISFADPGEDFSLQTSGGELAPHQILERADGRVRVLAQARVGSTSAENVMLEASSSSEASLKVEDFGGAAKKDSYRMTNPESEFSISESHIENRFFRLELNKTGEISRLYDKRCGREILTPGGFGNVFETYEDNPQAWEAWDVDADFETKPLDLFVCEAIKVVEEGPLRAAIRVTHKSENSTITQEIRLFSDVLRIDFFTKIDWREQRVLLKTAFPIDVLSPTATYEIQYGAIERPTHRNTSWDQAKFEVAAHKWMDLSESGYGVSLLNDCKYGCDIHENKMRLTLLRAPYQPSPTEPWGGTLYDQPADQGAHEVTYSLFPHEGSWQKAGTVRRGYELNVPIVNLGAGGELNSTTPFVEFDHDNLVLHVLKPADDGNGVILRFYESAGARGTCEMKFGKKPKTIFVCDLLEQNEQELPNADEMWRVDYKPFEIVTLRLLV